MEASEILFAGETPDASFYQRVLLPAAALGCDWAGFEAPPPQLALGRGEVRVGPEGPDLAAYRIVVLQRPVEPGWQALIPQLQAAGTKVVFELDYHLHAMIEIPEALEAVEQMLRTCDGVICSTEHIAAQYAGLNPRTFVCENGVDVGAYAFTRPPHDTVNIGWSGVTLLLDEMAPYLQEIAWLMRAREATNFVSIGQRFGDAMADSGAVAPERCLAIPLTMPDMYAPATSIFDVVFDPAGTYPWRLGRSRLRWLETAAAGLPFVGDPRIYPGLEDGVTGFHAREPVETARTILRLVDDPLLRASVGARAREAVAQRWSIPAVMPQWERALEAVAAA